MKTLFASTAIALGLSATAALATGPIAPMPPVVPVTPPAPMSYDWSGPYVGIYGALANGDMMDIGGPYDLNDGANFGGLFAGYRHDYGSVVAGAEIATTGWVDMYQDLFPTWEFERLTDLRVSVGREFGRALVYLSGGYTTTEFSAGGAGHNYNGWNAGLGVDVMVSDSFFVGGEYVYRSLESSSISGWTADFGTLQLRGGFRF